MFLIRAPLPHNDASAFLEPAFLLAKEGTLVGPSTQYIDLLYTKGFYSYTPVYFIALAGWINIFGMNAKALLAYTLSVHLVLLWFIWVLIRDRFDGTRLAALLGVISFFPTFYHGRAELTTLLFGALAWIALPVRKNLWRLGLAGILLGITLSATMPALGVSSVVAIGTYQLFHHEKSQRQRIFSFLILTTIAALTLVIIVGLVTQWQDGWGFAGAMWSSHVTVRGSALNVFPSLANLYAVFFCLIPLGILTLAPLILAVAIAWVKEDERWVKVAGFSYLIGFVAWFLLNKQYLLMQAHFAYLARPIFQASLVSSRRSLLRHVGIITALAFSIFYFYTVKASLLIPMLEDVDKHYSDVLHLAPQSGTIFATDGIYYPVLYKPHETISYEMFKNMNTWREYAEITPAAIREKYKDLYLKGPQEPQVIIISRWTLSQFGAPDPERYQVVAGEKEARTYKLLGQDVKLPKEALNPVIFVRIDKLDHPAND